MADISQSEDHATPIDWDKATQIDVPVEVPADGVVEASNSPTSFALRANASDVTDYARQGSDLVLTMRQGGVTRIKDFFAHGADFNRLVFVDGGQVQVADLSALPALAGDGVTDAQAVAATSAPESGSSGGSLVPILGGLALGAVGIKALNGSSSSGDTTPPAAPSAHVNDADANGRINASGTAEPGARITVTWPDETTAISSADQNGNWSIESSTVQTSGVVKVTATDAAGHESAPATLTYTDATAPTQAVQITAASADGDAADAVSGTLSAPLGAHEHVLVLRDGEVIGTATVSGTDWAYGPSAADLLTPGPLHTYTAEVEDAAGNRGPISGHYTVNIQPGNTQAVVGSGLNDTFQTLNAEGGEVAIDGRGGNDTFQLASGAYHVKLVYTLLTPADATGGNGSDVAIGFHVGNGSTAANADLIDLSQLLPATATAADIGDYVSVTASGANTVIAVNLKGDGAAQPAPLLTLNDVHTSLAELMANQQIVV